jgi:hypothetical protein
MGASKIVMREGEYFCHEIRDFSDMEWASRWQSDDGGKITVYYPDSSFMCSIVKGMGTFSNSDYDQFEIWFHDEEEPRPRVHTNLIMNEIEAKYLVWYERNNEFKTISNGNDKHRG